MKRSRRLMSNAKLQSRQLISATLLSVRQMLSEMQLSRQRFQSGIWLLRRHTKSGMRLALVFLSWRLLHLVGAVGGADGIHVVVAAGVSMDGRFRRLDMATMAV